MSQRKGNWNLYLLTVSTSSSYPLGKSLSETVAFVSVTGFSLFAIFVDARNGDEMDGGRSGLPHSGPVCLVQEAMGCNSRLTIEFRLAF